MFADCAKALLEGGCDHELQNTAGDTAFQVKGEGSEEEEKKGFFSLSSFC